MFTMRLAGLNVQVLNRYPRLENRCKDYIVPEPVTADLSLAASEKYLEQWRQEIGTDNDEFLEEGALFYSLYERLLDFDAFSLHGVLIQADGEGYAFSDAPGVGKTTHASRWKELLGERVSVVDGDHPILRMEDGKVMAYGTPFCGKEWSNENRCVPLKGICFLKRAEKTRVDPMDPREAILRFGWNDPCFRAENEELAMRQFDLYEQIAELVPCYWLYVNNFQPNAARICYEAITGRTFR